mgnify:CR=1 FL=1
MNNLLSYCGLVDVRINVSDKDLPVQERYFPPWYPKPNSNSDSLSPESYPVSPRKITTEFQSTSRQFTPFGKPLPPFPQFWLYLYNARKMF